MCNLDFVLYHIMSLGNFIIRLEGSERINGYDIKVPGEGHSYLYLLKNIWIFLQLEIYYLCHLSLPASTGICCIAVRNSLARASGVPP